MVDLAAIAASPQFQSFAANYLKGLTPSSTPISTYGLLGQGMEGAIGATEKQQKQQMLEKQFGLQEKQVAMQEKKFQQSMEKLRKEQEQQAKTQEALRGIFQKRVAPQQPAMQASPYGPYASGYGTDEYTPPEYTASQGMLNERAAKVVPDSGGLLQDLGINEDAAQLLMASDPTGKGLLSVVQHKMQQKSEQNLTGDAQAIASGEQLKKMYGEDSWQYEDWKEGRKLDKESKRELIKQRQSVLKSLTPAQQENAFAPYRPFGLTEPEIRDAIEKDISPADAARMKGYNESEIANAGKVYAPTSKNIGDQKQKDATMASLKAIEGDVASGMAPYAQKFKGYSLQQMIDASGGEKTDKLARFYAAKAFQPELAAMRVSAGTGSVTQAMIDGMVQKSLGSANALEGQVTSEIYTKMQEILGEWLERAVEASRESIQSGGVLKTRGGYKIADLEKTARESNMSVQEVLVELQRRKAESEANQYG